MATKNVSIIRSTSYWGQVLFLAILISFVIFGPLTAEAGVLFESSWNHSTGSDSAALSDGGKWLFGSGGSGRQQDPVVFSGGPGGENYLNLKTAGGGGWGSPYYINFEVNGGGRQFGNPDNFYCRTYLRIHQSWADAPSPSHWFSATENGAGSLSHHFIAFAGDASPDYPQFFAKAPFSFRLTVKPSGDKFASNLALEVEKWYCFEVHIQKIDEAGNERWYFRLDGKDITDKFVCFQGGTFNGYGKTLEQFYNDGGYYGPRYIGNLWMTSYDQETMNEGWDIAAVEVRDDRWPGLVDGPPPIDTTPPTGSIEITGVEGLTGRTSTTAVTLTLSASDADSGMGFGAEMQFSNDNATWSSPEPYSLSKAWTLLDTAPGTEQARTVYVKFKDVAGKWSSGITDSIILDKQPPEAPLW